MTFVDAAIKILQAEGKPVHFKELTRIALEQGLVEEDGKSPEAVMQSALAAEAKSGGRVERVKPGVFALVAGVGDVDAKDEEEDEKATDAEADADVEAGQSAGGATGGKRRRRGRRGGRGRRKGGATAATTTDADAGFPEPGTPEEALLAERMAEEAEAEDSEHDRPTLVSARTLHARAEDVDREWEDIPTLPRPNVDVDLVSPGTPMGRRMAPLPDDDALAAEYADEGEEMAAPPVEGEVVDEQTADEDRPMLTPIEADRGGRGRGRRERGRRGKERGRGRDRDRSGGGEAGRGQNGPPQQQAGGGQNQQQGRGRDRDRDRDRQRDGRDRDRDRDRGIPGPVPRAVERAGALRVAGGTPLAEAGLACLEALNDPRPVHTRQLAAMAVKRKLTTGDPEKLAEHMTIALLDDARDRVRRGLRPRAKQQGNGLFALTRARLEPELATAEETTSRWLDGLEAATVDALRRRLEKLRPSSLEKLARVYLERCGYVSVTFERKVEETIYLSAELPRAGGARRVLAGVVGGGGELGRRAVGELRAGVEAKGFVEGILLAAATLGPDAERELAERTTPIVDVLDAPALARAFAARGVGVLAATIPVSYLDVDLLGELDGK